jgi:hypothetical protein
LEEGDRMSFRLHEVDPIGLAMDWLETCKREQLAALIELYAETAVCECECERFGHFVGQGKISEYWRPIFALPPPRPFKLEQIWPEATGIALVYRFMDRSLVRVSFQFDAAGKIARSRCRPEPVFPPATAFRCDFRQGPAQTPTGKRQRT